MPTRVLVLVDKSASPPTCSVHFFGCTRRAAPEFERRFCDAVTEWLASSVGQSVRAQIGEERFDWGCAIDWVSPEIWRKHGLALRKSFFDATQTLVLDYQPVAPLPSQQSAGQAVVSTDVILRVPGRAWELLEETLALDAESHHVEPELRERITAALAQVKTVDPPTVTIAVRGGVAEIESAPDGIAVSIVDYDSWEEPDGK